MIFVMTAAVVSCSKDDEPNDYEPTYDGVSILLNAIEKLYNSESAPNFTESDIQEGLYLAQADSYQDSYNFIAELIENPKWDGKDVTIKLGENGEEGSLKIFGKYNDVVDSGVYNRIIVDIKEFTPYTLDILTKEAAENRENGKSKDIVIVK